MSKYLICLFAIAMAGCRPPVVNTPMEIYVAGQADHSTDAHAVALSMAENHLTVDINYQVRDKDTKELIASQEKHLIDPTGPYLIRDEYWTCGISNSYPKMPDQLFIITCDSTNNISPNVWLTTHPIRCNMDRMRDQVDTYISTETGWINVIVACELI